MTFQPIRDRQSVTPDGRRIEPIIAGVQVRPAVTQDDRGTLCEIFDPRWGFDDGPLVYVYQTTIRPRKIKGWVVHQDQDDRLFFSSGSVRVVLYDARPESPTYEMINERYFSAHNRGLLRIPCGVYHAIENIGETDVLFLNLPTRPYEHENPDKYRLPLDTSVIPYRFSNRPGG
jgi:dTDP-4-dehydrorhamnose 3,5-epimerase